MTTADDAGGDLFADQAQPAGAEALADLAQALPRRAPTAAARVRLLERVQTPALRWAPLFDKLSLLFDLPEPRLVELAEQAAIEANWQPLAIPGVRLFHLQGGPGIAGTDAGLVWIAAGADFPLHTHLGQERTLILEGELRESDGSLRRAGDEIVMNSRSSHAFRVISARPLLYAVVLSDAVEIGGVRFPPGPSGKGT